MKRLVTSLLVSAAFSASASNGTSERPLIMQPEISPDGTQIAFSYQGDIWTMSTSGTNSKPFNHSWGLWKHTEMVKRRQLYRI